MLATPGYTVSGLPVARTVHGGEVGSPWVLLPAKWGECREGQSHRGFLVVRPGLTGGPVIALEMELWTLTGFGTAGRKRGGGLTCAPHLWSGLPQEGLLISSFDGEASELRRGSTHIW